MKNTQRAADGADRPHKAIFIRLMASVIFNGGKEEADKHSLKRTMSGGLFSRRVAYHTEPPTHLTKWDMIEQSFYLFTLPLTGLHREQF